MFGFLPGPSLCCAKAAACYRAHFCGLCNAMRRDYGLWARGLINRDSTFLAVLGSALSAEPLRSSSATCCNPWAAPRDLFQDGATMHYAGAVTICGLSAKLDDDADDERGPRQWLAALTRHACHEPTGKAIGLLHALDFPVGKVMQFLRDDRTGHDGRGNLETAAEPTSRAYGEIVAHVGHLTSASTAVINALRTIGHSLGFLIYTKDAWEDWEADRRRGRFNPLRASADAAERREAIMPLVTASLASLPEALANLTLHRHRDLLSSMLVDGAAMSMQGTVHITPAEDPKDKKNKKRRQKESCCERCDCNCDCCHCCDCIPKRGASCDCNPCDGGGCDCGPCDCGCDCG